MEKNKVHKKKTNEYAPRLKPGNACIPTTAPTAKPPKPADWIAPLIILYSDYHVITMATHDCRKNSQVSSVYGAVKIATTFLIMISRPPTL